ncbi:hypothetical protein L1987_58677 [Smallanthus sonchifolius]|uniref:Uncharacterized protein n=1 Tax=Smallanthus sonchifolius TaxID=185202 RepID=A0ACB9D3G7_9ASTR|nr:hypothetical protein L1987_58677 [Smallanthus sonchifolius]
MLDGFDGIQTRLKFGSDRVTSQLIVVCMIAFVLYCEESHLTFVPAKANGKHLLVNDQNKYRHFFFTAMLFVYGRILSQRLVNTVTTDKFLFRMVHSFIKEEDVQLSVWPICMDTYDPYRVKGFSVLAHISCVPICSLFSFGTKFQRSAIHLFLLPASLIVINDIAAYIFGFFFGKTPLIKLSPKKTWEGFIGASVTTIISAFVDLSIGWLQCNPGPLFTPENSTLPEWFPWKEMQVLPVQWHALGLGLFASIIAPFGDFFASGFKRAFKIKDFGDSIPGHGGMTDRMDCQMVMAVFAYIYHQSFILAQSVSVGMIFDQIVMNLSYEEQRALYTNLGEIIQDKQHAMDSHTQNASLLMDEFSNPNGPMKELVNNHCSEFMQGF